MAMTRSLLAAAAASAALLSSACGFLADDCFSSWLPLAEARVDLAATVAAAGLPGAEYVESVESAPFAGADGADLSRVLAFVSSDGGSAFLALDPATLAVSLVRATAESGYSSLGRPLKATVNGFLSGALEFDPADLSAAPLALTPPASISSLLVDDTAGDQVYFFNTTGSSPYYINTIAYAADIMSMGGSNARQFDDEGSAAWVVDAEYLGSTYRLLCATSSGLGYVVSYENEAFLLGTAALLSDADAEITGPFPVADQRAWLTAAGVVALTRGSGATLTRYAYGPTLTTLDSFVLGGDTEGLSVLSFDAAGSSWFLYDSWDGSLYRLGVWW